jgi:hypothetical protein
MTPIKSPFWHILQRVIAERKALGKAPTKKSGKSVDKV